jgi:putative dimethyl sulfoxide reductase chaperone
MSGKAEATALVLEAPKDAHAAARSRMYALLAEAFAYPAGPVVTRLLEGHLLEELRDVAATLPKAIALPAVLSVAIGDNDRNETQIVYTGLFDVCTGRPAVSLLERRYGREPEQKLWEDLLRFYTLFGLDFSSGAPGENPDHLLLELEFMHYLSFLEAGTQGGRDDLRRGQRDFLASHLGRWTPLFAEALVKEQKTGPYAALAGLLNDFVTTDMQHLQTLLSSSEAGN